MKTSYDDYVKTLQALSDYWIGELSHIEFAILIFTNQRTLRWRKSEEVIPCKHFKEGVFSASGELVQAALPYCRRSIWEGISSLENRGLIKISRPERKKSLPNSYSICVKNIAKRKKHMDNSKLKTPKKLKNPRNTVKKVVQEMHMGSAGDAHGVVQEMHTEGKDIEGKDIEGNKQRKSSGLREVSVADAIKKSKKKNKVKRQEKIKKLKSREKLQLSANPLMSEIKALWGDRYSEHYGSISVSSATRIDFSIFKRAYKKTKPPVDLESFVNWVVECWGEIKENELGWMKSMSLLPSFSTFLRMYPKFVEAYPNYLERREVEAGRFVESDTRLLETSGELVKAQEEIKSLNRKLEVSEGLLDASIEASDRRASEARRSQRSAKLSKSKQRIEPVVDTKDALGEIRALEIEDIYAEGVTEK